MVGLVLVLGNFYETLLRSTIPVAMDGTITAVELRREKHPGIDDVHLVHTGKDTYHVDAAVALHLDTGDAIQKSAWSRSLLVDDEEVHLEPSRDFRGMLVVMPVVLLTLFIGLARERGSEG